MDSQNNRDPLQCNKRFIPLDLRKRIVKCWLDGEGDAMHWQHVIGNIDLVTTGSSNVLLYSYLCFLADISCSVSSEYPSRYLRIYSLTIAFNSLKNKGHIQVLEFPKEVTLHLAKLTGEVLREEAEKDEKFMKVLNSYTEFRARRASFNKATEQSYQSILRELNN